MARARQARSHVLTTHTQLFVKSQGHVGKQLRQARARRPCQGASTAGSMAGATHVPRLERARQAKGEVRSRRAASWVGLRPGARLEVLPRRGHGQALDQHAVRAALGAEVGRRDGRRRAPAKAAAAKAAAAAAAAAAAIAAAAAAAVVPAAAAAAAAAAHAAAHPAARAAAGDFYPHAAAAKVVPIPPTHGLLRVPAPRSLL